MNGMPSENVDNLDRRLKHIEDVCERLRSEINKLFAETRDLLKAHADSQKPEVNKQGDRSGE